MAKWLLLIWIRGCSGLDCEIPEYQTFEFDTEAQCDKVLELWMSSSPPVKKQKIWRDGKQIEIADQTGRHVGICYQPVEEGDD